MGELVVFEQRPSEVVKVRFAVVAVVLLGILASCSFLDDFVASAVNTGYRRAKSGATESLVAIFAVWQKC